MSWRGVTGAAGGLVLAVVTVIACGDTTTNNVTNVEAPSPESGTEASADGGSLLDSALSDVVSVDAADAPYDGPGCANDQSSVSDSCGIVGVCSSNECAAKDSLLVQCFTSGGGKRPPVDGCNDLGAFQDQEKWCCPPACVPQKNSDSSCDGAHRFISCPFNDGGPTVAPGAGCTQVTIDFPTSTTRGFCCPR